MKVLRICEYCSDGFEVENKEVNRGNGRFCSLSCSGKRKRGTPHTTNCKCAQCGKECYKTKSQLKNSKSGLYFCNRICKDVGQRLGGIKAIMPPHYGTAKIQEYRKLIAIISCAECGYAKVPEILEVHHVDRNRENNSLDNLKVLCPTCHQTFHFLTNSGRYSKNKNMGH